MRFTQVVSGVHLHVRLRALLFLIPATAGRILVDHLHMYWALRHIYLCPLSFKSVLLVYT